MDTHLEGLQLLKEGSDDIVVGISGFGSATMDGSRWMSMAEITGRTLYMLRYDAQELPWAESSPPQTLSELSAYSDDLHLRWGLARMAASGVADHLAGWLAAWRDGGRRVLLVGFSLGGAIAARAAMLCPFKGLEVILVSAAATDRTDRWTEVDRLGRLVNVYSRDDMALRYLYPASVGADDTPAAGLGPLCVTGPTVVNIDATDLIGSDHLWASTHLDRLVRMAMGCLWSEEPDCDPPGEEPLPEVVDGDADENARVRERCYRWFASVPQWWTMLGSALESDETAWTNCRRLDAWFLRNETRPSTAMRAGLSAMTIGLSRDCPDIAARGRAQLGGYVRSWVKQPC